jgi:hypothetical protein
LCEHARPDGDVLPHIFIAILWPDMQDLAEPPHEPPNVLLMRCSSQCPFFSMAIVPAFWGQSVVVNDIA